MKNSYELTEYDKKTYRQMTIEEALEELQKFKNEGGGAVMSIEELKNEIKNHSEIFVPGTVDILFTVLDEYEELKQKYNQSVTQYEEVVKQNRNLQKLTQLFNDPLFQGLTAEEIIAAAKFQVINMNVLLQNEKETQHEKV